jgi:hypothetical protein
MEQIFGDCSLQLCSDQSRNPLGEQAPHYVKMMILTI